MQTITLTPETWEKEMQKISALVTPHSHVNVTFEVIQKKKKLSLQDFINQSSHIQSSFSSNEEIRTHMDKLRNWD